MKKLCILVLVAANTVAVAVLLAIPIGKLLGLVEEEVDATAVFGWLIFFVPLLTSAYALWNVQSSPSALKRPAVLIAMPGSFLAAFATLFTLFKSSFDFASIAIPVTILLGLNVLALWEPFKDHLQSSAHESKGKDDE